MEEANNEHQSALRCHMNTETTGHCTTRTTHYIQDATYPGSEEENDSQYENMDKVIPAQQLDNEINNEATNSDHQEYEIMSSPALRRSRKSSVYANTEEEKPRVFFDKSSDKPIVCDHVSLSGDDDASSSDDPDSPAQSSSETTTNQNSDSTTEGVESKNEESSQEIVDYLDNITVNPLNIPDGGEIKAQPCYDNPAFSKEGEDQVYTYLDNLEAYIDKVAMGNKRSSISRSSASEKQYSDIEAEEEEEKKQIKEYTKKCSTSSFDMPPDVFVKVKDYIQGSTGNQTKNVSHKDSVTSFCDTSEVSSVRWNFTDTDNFSNRTESDRGGYIDHNGNIPIDRYNRKMSTMSTDSVYSYMQPRRKHSEVRFCDILENEDGSVSSIDPIKSSPDSVAAHLRRDSIILSLEKYSFNDQQFEVGKEEKPEGKLSQKYRIGKRMCKDYKHHVQLVLILLGILTLMIIVWYYQLKKTYGMTSSGILNQKTGEIHLRVPTIERIVYGKIGSTLNFIRSKPCTNYSSSDEDVCLNFDGRVILKTKHTSTNGVTCYSTAWQILQQDVTTKDCYDLSNSYWYGPFNSTTLEQPQSQVNFTLLPSNTLSSQNELLALTYDRFWISSDGTGFQINSGEPSIWWNTAENNEICFGLTSAGEMGTHAKTSDQYLNYTVCNGETIYDTHRFMRHPSVTNISDHIVSGDTPVGESPLTVWSEYEPISDTSNTKDHLIRDSIAQLMTYNLSSCILEVKGKWSENYGDLTFDPTEFANLTDMNEYLRTTRCKLVLPVTPFCSYKSPEFTEGVTKGYFMKGADDVSPRLIKLHFGFVGVLNVSKEDARDWFRKRLHTLLNSSEVLGFSVEYGSERWLSLLHKQSGAFTPIKEYKVYFNRLVASSSPLLLQSFYGAQSQGAYLRVPTVVSYKSTRACISSTFYTVLYLNMMGYSHIMADGIEVEERYRTISSRPSLDLYIRWMQLVRYLPAVKYTVKPWHYGDIAMDMFKDLISDQNGLPSHSPLTVSLTNTKVNKFTFRPLWWFFPDDMEVHKASAQFMTDKNTLVAPILCEGTRSRDIYLPAGIWSDRLFGTLVSGKKWLRSYLVSQTQIPTFIRVENT